jgi:hypothetical protein
MSDPKPLRVLWSKTAVHMAGTTIDELQSKLIAEASDIASQTHDWFLHALPGAAEGACFVCTGHELPDIWKIFVQSGLYAPMAPIRGDHPDPTRRGKVFKYPEVIKDSDNEIFAAYEDISDH